MSRSRSTYCDLDGDVNDLFAGRNPDDVFGGWPPWDMIGTKSEVTLLEVNGFLLLLLNDMLDGQDIVTMKIETRVIAQFIYKLYVKSLVPLRDTLFLCVTHTNARIHLSQTLSSLFTHDHFMCN